LVFDLIKFGLEKNWKNLHSSDVIWNDDFLMHYAIEVLGRDNSTCWRFLTPKKVFTWDKTDEGYGFWSKICDDWDVFIRENKNKITIDKMSERIMSWI
jgi:hypothetical protein